MTDLNRTVWEFSLEPQADKQIVRMHAGAEILSIQVLPWFELEPGWYETEPSIDYSLGPRLCIFALVDPTKDKEDRVFQIFGTGLPLPEGNWRFIGTYQLRGGRHIFHLFEVLREE